ncbi:hypothetical protein Tsubulata_007719 [Turnera subulata]|uniref:Transcription factor CBF/NF-Y/archaeal histone domain-containing protein n=1 Tax=Turnera subulata TaxID=218843 RepID=A0A9Q0JMH3_9ROSI|nr:hypothetical protein Tsubulata_007719 [Turnera subulata]
MAEAAETVAATAADDEIPTRPEFPTARVKKIMKLDKDINKANSDALFLVAHSADLFLRSLAKESAGVASEKKRRIVKLEHLRIAVKRHRPTSDFLLDSLPAPAQPSNKPPARSDTARTEKPPAQVPPGTRRIDHFFSKTATEAPVQITDT